MTTAQSSRSALKKQAEKVARTLKAVARGDKVTDDHGVKLAAAAARDSFTFVIVMDDKVIHIEMPLKIIRETSQMALVEWIIAQMQESTVQ